MYRILFFSLFLLAGLFGVAKGVGIWFDSSDPASHSSLLKSAAPGGPKEMETKGDETTLRRDGSGRFYLTAQANGRDTRFLVDTGADVVALSLDEAESLDVKFDRANFQPITQTASGTGMGERVKIERLTIGDHEFRDVDAVVVDGLETNLLGQSIIHQLGTVEMRQDTMVIHHNA
jgi:aspartyl protease family protein